MKNDLVTYMRNYVIGKPLKTDDVIYHLENDTLEGVYSDIMTFSDLLVTETGIQFNMTTVTNEKIYMLDANKKRSGIKKDYTGTSVFQYKLAIRKSSGEITGYMYCLSSTVTDHTMEAVVYGVYDVVLQNNQLIWKEQQLLYRDLPSEENKYRPVAFDPDVRFYLEDGKLRFEYVPKVYDVDVSTLAKTLSEEQYPSFVSKES